jgi:hypothetical protein
MFERFTQQSRRVVVLAQEEARALDHNYIGTEHILLGLLQEGKGSAAQALKSMDITLDAARHEVEAIVGRGTPEQTPSHIPFTASTKNSLELALREALQLGQDYIGTGHILLALTQRDDNVAVNVLARLGANVKDVRIRAIQELIDHPDRPNDEFEPAERQRRRVLVRARPEILDLLDRIDARLTAIEDHLGIVRPSPDEVRALDERLAKVRRDKEAALVAGDQATAAALRDLEKELLLARASAKWEAQAEADALAAETGQGGTTAETGQGGAAAETGEGAVADGEAATNGTGVAAGEVIDTDEPEDPSATSG